MRVVVKSLARDRIRAVVAPSASVVEQHAWDALVADGDFYHCHGWLAGLDHALGPAELLTVHGAAGLAGGCALWNGERAPGLFRLPDYFADVPGCWDRDYLWIGARRSTHNEIPCVVGRARTRVLRALLQAAAAVAAGRGLAGVVIPYMPLAKALELVSLHGGARAILHSAEAAMAVPAGGLRGMLGRAGARHRRSRTRAELAAFARKGNVVAWKAVEGDVEDAAARLIAQNRSRYGSSQGVEWMRRMFDGQRRSGVLETAVAMVACRRERIVGLAVLYRFGKVLHCRYFGTDYALNDGDYRYFVLGFYQPLDYASEHGFETIALSISSLRAKALRGAMIAPLAAVVVPVDHEPPSSWAVARHNARFAGEYIDKFPERLHPDWVLASSRDPSKEGKDAASGLRHAPYRQGTG